MGRSVVLRQTPRCPRCLLAPRWCICDAARPIDCPLQVDVLAHHQEDLRPSSTGLLIRRLLPESGRHVYQRERPLERAEVVRSGRELWIMHPDGQEITAPPPAERLQVLLLDGTWRQATEMLKRVEGWGRRVRLPLAGASRNWLRTQAGPGRWSTIEALQFLLGALGLERPAAELRAQFELHVFASLMARGHKARALDYLRESPAGREFPETIGRLLRSRRGGGDSLQ